MKKNDNEVKVSFADSMSAQDVTGSNIFVSTPHYNILLDCGMSQSNDKRVDYIVNNRKPKEYKIKDLNFIFLEHLHIDHIGLIPLYYKRGFRGKIIVPNGSKQILQDMLMDCSWISERDALVLEKEPLYSENDVLEVMNYVVEKSINEKIELNDEITFQFLPSGHLLNGCQLLLWIKYNGITKCIGYTSDIGNPLVSNYYVGKLEKIKSCDLLIGESTYGDRQDLKVRNKERQTDLNKLKTVIDKQVLLLKGRVIIPVFAQSRCPSILTLIYQLYKDTDFPYKIYIDSPLAIKLLKDYSDVLNGAEKELFDEIMEWDNLKFVKESIDSKNLVMNKEPCVILSTSGMMINGRIRHHFKSIVGNPNATILFCGYATEGSLASLLKDPKRKEINIDGKVYTIKCTSDSLKSMSGHAPFDVLLDYYKNVNCNKIILQHGSVNAKENLAKMLKKELEKECKTTRVVCANNSLKFTL